MTDKIFPVVLVAINGPRIRMKYIEGPDEYDEFCALHVREGTELKEFKTLLSIYTESVNKLIDRYLEETPMPPDQASRM